MAKRKISSFGFSIYNNDGEIQIGFEQAKKVPKAYANFIATMQIACLNTINKIIGITEKGVQNVADNNCEQPQGDSRG